MSRQVQKRKTGSSAPQDQEESTGKAEPADLSMTDEFLDEIDDLLEENAETFVKQYKQQGGQ